MKKTLVFKDGERAELSPLTYDEFVLRNIWLGGSDTAFDSWKRKNGYVEISDYREEALEGATIELSPEAPIFDNRFLFSSDGVNWFPEHTFHAPSKVRVPRST